MYKEMKKIQTGNRSLINSFQLNAYQKASIVEVGNKHGNGDEFLDFVDLLFFFGITNVRVGGKILGSVGRLETHIFFFLPNILLLYEIRTRYGSRPRTSNGILSK